MVTAASLFDGHDASINIMRRMLQTTGCEVIHLGHNRSVHDVVMTALHEDAQGIAISSYQGGHLEYFKYMVDLLKEKGADHIKVFGGGGGVIVPSEIDALHRYGVTKIFSSEDGRKLGLQGMINAMVKACDFDVMTAPTPHALARKITIIEQTSEREEASRKPKPVLGITGTGGAGKSSLTDELLRRFLSDFPQKTVAVLSVDPTKRKTGGALLGDRIRMNTLYHPDFRDRVYMRSLATRDAAHRATSAALRAAIAELTKETFDLIVVETAGIGQSDSEITDLVDVSLYVMTPEYGAASQLEKIDMLDFANLVALNKSDKRGALDALRDVKKQVQRGRKAFDQEAERMPVFATTASLFNDPGTDRLYGALIQELNQKCSVGWVSTLVQHDADNERFQMIPSQRTRYLGEIAEEVRSYKQWAQQQKEHAELAYGLWITLKECGQEVPKAGTPYTTAALGSEDSFAVVRQKYQSHINLLEPHCQQAIAQWPELKKRYQDVENVYEVRDKSIRIPNYTTSLSGLSIPKVALPTVQSWGEILAWQLLENVPGSFPYTAGVFEYKRQGEDPTRMFAGEGTPERTNRRFHYVSRGQPAVRLSTAFDSVTLYGEDPGLQPDVYGKVGNAGVSIATLDDAKKLYSGFNLLASNTSVSMTINGPAPTILAFFLNAAIDQRAEQWLIEQGQMDKAQAQIKAIYQAKGVARPTYEGPLPEGNNGLGLQLLGVTSDQILPPEIYNQIKQEALETVRGTVQADILKEDQAQNTCIFSTEFSLKVMGDMQRTFVEKNIRNFYSVSISGYHIAEAGANPITQVAFTLANGFTYVEYYLSRGMSIDSFAPNLSFFFSNGMDPEYSVIGRVARRIWAVAMKHRYGANERSQKLKYHIQTSGRSLHAQEIDFNDIRTTLQALYAIYDNCNSLHTNAYDEAITTPTEESVRRALAIQLIINRELGVAKNENPLQGSYIVDTLTELVEEALLSEFIRLNDRGGVLGAMETMYQRGKIQEESLLYEHGKHSGVLPIVGVNTFINPNPPALGSIELIRSNAEEKKQQIDNVEAYHIRNAPKASEALENLRNAAKNNQNIFDQLMEASKVCSLGQISQTLYEVGGQYRRNM